MGYNVLDPNMPTRLANRWDNRLCIRARLRKEKVFVKEPSVSESHQPSDGEVDGSDNGLPSGPPLSTDFLQLNSEILYELFDSWGIRPKPTVKQIHKEVGQGLFDYSCANFIPKFSNPSLSVANQSALNLMFFISGCFAIQLCQVKKYFQIAKHTPVDKNQPYLDAWSIKRLVGFAKRRQKDCARRGQTPRVPRFKI